VIVDTSALVAILGAEPEARMFSEALESADIARISVVSRVELTIVLERFGDPAIARRVDLFLRDLGIVEEPVSLQQGMLAREAFYDYGKGRHPAGLNFGDCFSYALAKALDEPLLFKGTDFSLTDVRIAG
jgi:ribonuclease VapC